jgi:hypothetical protein
MLALCVPGCDGSPLRTVPTTLAGAESARGVLSGCTPVGAPALCSSASQSPPTRATMGMLDERTAVRLLRSVAPHRCRTRAFRCDRRRRRLLLAAAVGAAAALRSALHLAAAVDDCEAFPSTHWPLARVAPRAPSPVAHWSATVPQRHPSGRVWPRSWRLRSLQQGCGDRSGVASVCPTLPRPPRQRRHRQRQASEHEAPSGAPPRLPPAAEWHVCLLPICHHRRASVRSRRRRTRVSGGTGRLAATHCRHRSGCARQPSSEETRRGLQRRKGEICVSRLGT